MNSVQMEPNSAIADNYLKQPYARIILPESDGTYRGEILEFPGCISIGDTAGEALAKLESVAHDWISAALERGQNIPSPVETSNDFSGRLVLRLPKNLHKKAAWFAERENTSLNQFIVASLSESIGEKKTTRSHAISLTTINHQQNLNFISASNNVPFVPLEHSNHITYSTMQSVKPHV